MITIIARCFVAEGEKENFIEAAKEMINYSRNEAGNISYDLYQEFEDDNVLTFIEKWKDEQAIALHNKERHVTDGLIAISKFMVDKMQIYTYRKIFMTQ